MKRINHIKRDIGNAARATKRLTAVLLVKLGTLVRDITLLALMTATVVTGGNLLVAALIDAAQPKPPTTVSIPYVLSGTMLTGDLQKIYLKLRNASGIKHKIRGMFILEDSTPNAFVTGSGHIYMTTAFLELIKTEDEFALVVGHEIAHVMLGHLEGQGNTDNRKNEFHSDLIGVYLMQKAGYNPCVGKELWERLDERWGMNIFTTSHPSAAQRARYLNLPQCKKK